VTARLLHYRNNGTVTPNNNLNVSERNQAEYLIELLNLNCPRLVGSRKRQAHIMIDTLGPNPTDGDIRLIETHYLQPDANGRLRSFISLSRTVLASRPS
jgi:hypothetical protein